MSDNLFPLPDPIEIPEPEVEPVQTDLFAADFYKARPQCRGQLSL